MSPGQMAAAIAEHKRGFGRRLVILGHHYQQDEVIQFADFTGDSLKLSQLGAKQKDAEFIVFCGVHFMAESADILATPLSSPVAKPTPLNPHLVRGEVLLGPPTPRRISDLARGEAGREVKVILPDLSAGCSMADMADIEQLEDAWEYLVEECDADLIPITYVNSAANIKAFCGGHGGACCTSSNAARVLEWAFGQGEKVIFLPDQHLGRNTGYAMGVPLDEMVVYDPHEPNGGLTPRHVADARIILWKGHCSVHGLFTVAQCDEIRRLDPEYKILVHPECTWEVVQKADLAGSTEFIIKTVREAPAGSKWAIGTEIHLVNRLATAYPDKAVRSLAGIQCLCTTMYRIDLKHLLWCLDELAAGRVVNRISVDPETKRLALMALERMLANVSAQPVGVK
jgi:quinolinate synthase